MSTKNAPNKNDKDQHELTLDRLNERLTELEKLCQPLFIKLTKPKRRTKSQLLGDKIEQLLEKDKLRFKSK